MNTNGLHRWGGAKTWVLIALIFLLAILVPVGLYFISTLSFTNGTTGTNLSAPDTGSASATPAPAGGAAPAQRPTLGTPAPIPAGSKTMALLVIDEQTKQPIAGARVQLNGRMRFTGTTGSDGKVNVPVPPGDNPNFNIRISGKGYVPQRLLWAPYNPDFRGGVPASFTVQMGGSTTIRGKVVDDSGQPVEGATVVLDFTKRFADTHEQVDVNGNNRNRPIKTAEDGTWSFNGAPVNCDEIGMTAWDLNHVTGDFYQTTPYKPVSALYDGTAVFTMQRGIVLTATVVGPDGSPVSGASISWGQNRYVSNALPAQKTDASGKFSRHYKPGDQITLMIQAVDCAPMMEHLVAAEQDQSVKIQLQRAQTITGKVVTYDGKPVRGARIQVEQWEGVYQILDANFQTDSAGNFHWNNAPADPVTVSVNAPGMRGVQQQTIAPGQDNIIKLGRPSRIRGTVTDAQTGQPIENFQMVFGILFNNDQPVTWQPGWQPQDNMIRPGGKFEINDTFPYAGIAVKVEAPGYLPTASHVVKADEGDATLDLKMKPGKDLVLTIETADGKPVAGVTAAIAAAGEQVFVQDGREINNGMMSQATSGADGTVRFSPQMGNFRVVAFGNAGYTEADQDDLAKSPVLTLSPWGKIQGKMMIGSKPAVQQDVSVYQSQPEPYDPQQPHINFGLYATTDNEGNFSIDRVPAGAWSVGRNIPMGPNRSSTVSLGVADVQPGQTVTLNLGGTGRPVVGKVILPSYFSAHSDWRYGFSQIMSTRAIEGPPIPLLMRMLSQERQQQWLQNWLKTDEGKAWRAKQAKEMAQSRSFPFAIASDGTFHVDDVPAGNYQVNINIQQTTGPNGGWGQPIGTGTMQFTVPEMSGGRSDDPLTLDPIAVIKLGHYDVGDDVADMSLITTDAKSLKFSDLRGKYVLLVYGSDSAADLAAPLKDVYAQYGQDSRLFMLTIMQGFFQKGTTPSRASSSPWTQAAPIANPGNNFYLGTNFGFNHAWLIGPDGKVVGKDLTGDAIKSAVSNALGAPQAATEPSTMP
jgi:hypothetical protein